MIRHFTKEDLPKLSERKPFCLFFCESGGMGCSGLLMGIWPNNECCVANIERCKDNPEYSKFFDEILSYMPEFPSVRSYRGPIELKREPFDPGNASVVYLGVGNHALVYPEFKCMIKDWNKYQGIMNYVQSFMNTNNVDIFEESMKGNFDPR